MTVLLPEKFLIHGYNAIYIKRERETYDPDLFVMAVSAFEQMVMYLSRLCTFPLSKSTTTISAKQIFIFIFTISEKKKIMQARGCSLFP